MLVGQRTRPSTSPAPTPGSVVRRLDGGPGGGRGEPLAVDPARPLDRRPLLGELRRGEDVPAPCSRRCGGSRRPGPAGRGCRSAFAALLLGVAVIVGAANWSRGRAAGEDSPSGSCCSRRWQGRLRRFDAPPHPALPGSGSSRGDPAWPLPPRRCTSSPSSTCHRSSRPRASCTAGWARPPPCCSGWYLIGRSVVAVGGAQRHPVGTPGSPCRKSPGWVTPSGEPHS